MGTILFQEGGNTTYSEEHQGETERLITIDEANTMAPEATESCIDLGPDYTKAFINSTSEEGITEGANNASFVDKYTLQGLRTIGSRILILRV